MICFFLFYNKSLGIQRHFAIGSELKHCDVICYDGESWICLQSSSRGVEYRLMDIKKVERMLNHLAIIPELIEIIGVDVETRARFPWRPWWVRSCNEFCRYVSGVDIGFTLNPRHLCKKLLKYDGKRNFQIIYAWRRTLWDSSVVTTSRIADPMT